MFSCLSLDLNWRTESVPPRTASSLWPSTSTVNDSRLSRQDQSLLPAHSIDVNNGDNRSPNSEATPSKSSGSSASSGARSSSLAAAELEPDGQWRALNIDSGNLWVAYVKITTNSALRILLQMPRGSPFAIYGRRNVAPSITQHDFSQFFNEGPSHSLSESRFRRHLTVTRSSFNTSLVKPVEPGRWFLALYNDYDVAQEVYVSLTLTN